MAERDPLVNHQLTGNYRILRKIGEGGVALVYEAVLNGTGEHYAVKILRQSWLNRDDVVRRFRGEAEIMKRFDHRHILKVYDLGTLETGQPYFIMQYVAGGNLGDFLVREKRPLTLRQASIILLQIASALNHAHQHRIIHRDLKPGNILLENINNALLTDFGIARRMDRTQMTLVEQQPGTPEYMSPEQVQGEDATEFSDQYALAVNAYWIVTGRLPFRGEDGFIVLNQQLNMQPVLPSALNPRLPADMDKVILRGLSKSPEQRFPSVIEFARAFERVVNTMELDDMHAGTRVAKPVNSKDETISYPDTSFRSPTAVTRGWGTTRGSQHQEYTGTPYPGAGVPNRLREIQEHSKTHSGYPGYGIILLVVGVFLVSAFLFLMFHFQNPATIQPDETLTETASQPASTLTLTLTSTAISTPITPVTPDDTPTVVTIIPTATATNSPTATDTPVPSVAPTTAPTLTFTASPTEGVTSSPMPSATETPTYTPTIPAPGAAELLRKIKSDMGGSPLTFNCKLFIDNYVMLKREVETGNADYLYNGLNTLTDETQDYMQIIYDQVCQKNPDASSAPINATWFSGLRSDVDNLLGI